MDNFNGILEEDILDHYGRLLLAKGSRVSEEVMDELKKRSLEDKVIIKDKSDSSVRVSSKGETNYTLIGNPEHDSVKTNRNLAADYSASIVKRIPSINIELVGKASNLVSALISVSRSQSWGLPINALTNQMPWVYSHSVNVAILACSLSYWLKLDSESTKRIALGALLHDVGKVLIPMEIINKPGKLSDEEWLLIKAHSRLGYSMLEPYKLSEDILNIILQHHERFDGKGYPQGLSGSQINLNVQLVTIADIFDGITSARPYHPTRDIKETLTILDKERDTVFKSYLLDELKKMLGISLR